MKIKQKTLKQLRQCLPAGSAKEIRQILDGKFSLSYIYRVLNPDGDEYNEEIIDAAIRHLENLQKKRHAKERKIESILS